MQDEKEVQELLQKGLKELQSMKVRQAQLASIYSGRAGRGNMCKDRHADELRTEANRGQPVLSTG